MPNLKKRIMNKQLLLILSLFFSLSFFSQTKEEALRDANITAKATLNSDFKTVLKYTYPNVVEIMGGKEKALQLISKTMETMKKEGFIFKSSDVLEVSKIVNEQNQIRCFVKNKNVLVFNQVKITSDSYLLGIYNEETKVWNFIEAKQLFSPFMSTVLPDFKTSLVIPQGTMKTEKI